MTETDIKSLKERSDTLQLRFVCAVFAGFLIFAVLWWASEHGYKAAAAVAAVAFVMTLLYAGFVWVLFADVRIKLRQARRGA